MDPLIRLGWHQKKSSTPSEVEGRTQRLTFTSPSDKRVYVSNRRTLGCAAKSTLLSILGIARHTDGGSYTL
jgi:hypothetical protein